MISNESLELAFWIVIGLVIYFLFDGTPSVWDALREKVMQ